MAKKWSFTGVLIVIMVFTLAITGCDKDSGGGGSSDPISVNLSLPAIQSVATFDGDFVSNQAEAWDLVGEVFMALGDLSDGFGEDIYESKSLGSIQLAPKDIARPVYKEPFETEIFNNDEIFPGAVMTGFVKGGATVSVKNENNPFGSVGDYQEMSMNIKLAINFDAAYVDSLIINGKLTLNEDMLYRLKVASLNPERADLTLRLNASTGYAISVSKGGKGLKLVLKQSMKVDTTLKNIQEDDFLDILEDLESYSTTNISVDIYDKNNTKQYSKTFSSLEDMYDYLDNIGY